MYASSNSVPLRHSRAPRQLSTVSATVERAESLSGRSTTIFFVVPVALTALALPGLLLQQPFLFGSL